LQYFNLQFRENIKKNEAKYLEKLKDVEEILKEKTEAYKCGDKTVEITEYNLCDQEDMIGINNEEEGEEECQENEEVGSEDEKVFTIQFRNSVGLVVVLSLIGLSI